MSIAASIEPAKQGSRPEAPAPTGMDRAQGIANAGGRVLIALLFVLAGAAKILGPQPFLAHMVRLGVPTIFFPAVIALELGAGFALLIGWRVREAAGALAVFCVMTATIFHHDFGVSAERTLFFKDLAISGGLLAFATTTARSRR